jgi:hypothetical protein
VREVKPSGYRITNPTSGYFDVSLTSSQTVTKSFGNTTNVLISGTVFNDLNSDKIKNTGERGLSSWRVFVDKDGDGVWDANENSVLTDSSGSFTFKALAAGAYKLRVVQQTGWSRTTPSAGYLTVTLAAGATGSGKLFGEHHV